MFDLTPENFAKRKEHSDKFTKKGYSKGVYIISYFIESVRTFKERLFLFILFIILIPLT